MKHDKILRRTTPLHNTKFSAFYKSKEVFQSWFHVRECVADRDAPREFPDAVIPGGFYMSPQRERNV
jgi:hypothetical protein